MMKVLMVAPEVAPFVKVGGLADVVGALPKALYKRGIDVRIVCPLYGSLTPGKDWVGGETPLEVHMGPGSIFARVWETSLPDEPVPVYFIEHKGFFDRHEVYAGPWGDHVDNGERFSFLSRAAIDLCSYLDWIPDVFHCHDWATGFVPVYLNTVMRGTPFEHSASIITIHNLKFQGLFRPELLNFAGLPWDVFKTDGLECMGNVSMLKGGIYHATKVTTVSPTYAEEIQGPELGEGLNHILKFRAADLVGILNGIDAEAWDPRKDAYLPAPISPDDLSGRALSKQAVQKEMGLAVNPDIPLFATVSRLYDQKGLDLLAGIVDGLMDNMVLQLAVLGSGDKEIEGMLAAAAERHPGRVAVHFGFNEGLAHRLYGGADVFLVPSRFEPCGLTQMYSMRYGAPPLVRSTGGLVDTVEQYEEGRHKGTGFRFEEASQNALYYTIGWAVSTYYDRPEEFQQLIMNGMKQDFSWKHSADAYIELYRWSMAARDWTRAMVST